ACVLDGFSARRFAEYLSLGQVPPAAGARPGEAFPASTDEVFGPLGDNAEAAAQRADANADPQADAPETPERRAFRAPWKWERLRAESKVVASEDRWERRLKGLVHECELQRRELARTEPGSPRIDHLAFKIADLNHLGAFALPIVRTLDRQREGAE